MKRRVRAVIIADGKVLVIRRYRPDKDKHYWIFPGGGVEEGESDLDTLQRELQVELGISIMKPTWYATVPFKAPKELMQEEVFYTCVIKKAPPGELAFLEKPKNGTYEPMWLTIADIKPDQLLEPFAIRDKLIGGG